jgi:peptidylprolyl isomerase
MLRRARFLLEHSRRNFQKYVPHEPVEGNSLVYLDLTTESQPLGRVSIELFTDTVPRTCENFRSLCTGERGLGGGVPLSYKGVPFHRIVPGWLVQGGDIKFRDGRGVESIFGYPFGDESFAGKAGRNLCGTLAMASSGPNYNGSQFFFNVRDSPHLDGRFVVFGQVLHGWDLVLEVATMGSRCGTPGRKVWVADCGQSGGARMADVEMIPSDPSAQLLPGQEVLNMLSPR